MKNTISKLLLPALLVWLAFSLQGCREDQFTEGGRPLILEGGLQFFEPVTRAGEEAYDIAMGTRLYLNLDGQKTYATYNSTTQQWRMNALPDGNSGSVSAAIFLTSTQSGGGIAMTGTGSYSNTETATTITATIRPLTARLRFRGKAGASVKVSGLTYYTSISSTSHTFTSSSNNLSLTVMDDGYTPYVYVVFTGSPTMNITYDGRTITKSYGTDILQAGRSGYIDLDTGETDFSGTYYIRNVATGLFLEAGNSWGTRASLGHGMDFMVEQLEDGKYRLETQVYNGSKHYLGSDDNGEAFYVDMGSENGQFTLERQEGGYLIRHSSGVVLTAEAGSTIVGPSEGDGDYSLWQFLTVSDMLAEMQKATSSSPKDATWLIKDANFGRNNRRFYTAWTEIDTPWKAGVNLYSTGNNNAQFWGQDVEIATAQQTILQVPNGVYELTCQGFYRYNDTEDNTNYVAVSTHEDGTEEIHSYLFANESMSPLCSIASEDVSSVTDWFGGDVDSGLPSDQRAASAAFTQGLYANNRVRVRVTDGVLRLGVKKVFHPGCDWTVFDNMELKYYGPSATFKPASSVSVTGTTTTLTVGNPVQLKATVLPSDASNKAVRWESSDRNVVRVSNTGLLTPLANGTATITARALDGSDHQKSFNVTVSGGAASAHEYVDLGLSVKWATCNVGASFPGYYGDYYAWGETETKSNYSWSTYLDSPNRDGMSFTRYSFNGKTQLDLSDDVAHVKWGGNWRMPTEGEWEELCNPSNCNWNWTSQSGKSGYLVTSNRNGNSIFLPAAGRREDTSFGLAGSDGCYWSSSLGANGQNLASYIYFNSGNNVNRHNFHRFYGHSVRPVCP